MVLGIFDWVVLIIIFTLNVTHLKNLKISILSGCFYSVLFILVLPFVSQYIEVQRVKNTIGIMDSFEIWYTYIKYPIYWIVGTVQIYVTAFKDCRK